jgi:tetratricopeptide (TPR) repeat protein
MPFIPSTPSGPQEGSSVRLDSWKEIAAYLGRAERTAKRWESERALPVHRLPGGGRASVYALASELDEWLTSARPEELEKADGADVPGEDDHETDAAASMAAPPQTEAPRITVSPPTTSPATGVRSWPWRIPLLVLLLVGLAFPAVFLVTSRATSAHISSNLNSQPANNAPADAEKQLAHELYLKGRYEWNQRTPDSLNRALDDFTQAIVHDPNDAKSYAGLADTYNLLQIFSTLPLADSYPRAIAAAKRAIALDDSLAEAHRALAFSEFYGLGDWRDSEKEFRRAIQLDPKDSLTRTWYGNAFAMSGRFEEFLEQLDKAQELDPTSNSTLSNKGIILFNSGRREEGIALLKDIERSNPDYFLSHFYLMVIGFHSRDFRTFLDEGQKTAETRNDPVGRDVISSAREGYARAGENGLLKSLYTKQKEYYELGKYSPGLLAMTCVAMGKRQEALDVLEAAYTRHQPDVLWILANPDLMTLKDEPRGKALLKKINFPSGPQDESPGTVHAADGR